MDAAGIGRIANGARNVGAESDRSDPGCDGRRGSPGGAAGRQTGIMRIPGLAMKQVGGEPAIGEGRRIGPPQDDGSGGEHVVDHRAVLVGDQILLQAHAVRRREARLIEVDLHGDRDSGERTDILAAGQSSIDPRRLGESIFRTTIDDGIDRGIDGLEAGQGSLRDLCRGYVPRTHQGRNGTS